MGTAKRHTGNQQVSHDWDGLAELLRDLKKCDDESVPKGWYPAKEWAQIWGLSRHHASEYLRKGIEIGRVETRKFRINSRPTPHYRKVGK